MLFVKNILTKWFKGNDIKSTLPIDEIINPNAELLFKDFFIKYLKSLDGAARSRSYSSTLYLAPHIVDGLGNYKMSQINKTVLKEFQ